jgi:hypothetical protein
MSSESLTSLLEVTEEIVALSRGLPTVRTKSTKYRHAIGMVHTGGTSMRKAAELCGISRKQLKLQYAIFCESGMLLCDYKYIKLKRGRKSSLSSGEVATVRIAAHTLDGLGHPTSKTSLNEMIVGVSGTKKILSRATLSKYRRKTKLPKKTVRNGPSVRLAKSKAEYILDFHDKLKAVITKYKIKKELMYGHSISHSISS